MPGPRRVIIAAAIATVVLTGCATTVGGAGTATPRTTAPTTPQLVVSWQRTLPGITGDDNQLQGGSADDSRLYVSSLLGRVFALSRRDGSLEWAVRPGHLAQVGVGVAGGSVFYFDKYTGTTALDPATGQTLWQRKTYFESNAASYEPAYAGGLVALKDDTGIVGIQPRTGKVRWTVSRDDYTIGNHAPVSDGRVFYAVLGDIHTDRRSLAAISASTGRVLWQVTAPYQDVDYSVFTAGPTVLLVAQMGGELTSPTIITAVDTATHRIRWNTRTTGAQPSIYAPSGTDRALVFPTDKGLQGIALTDGSIAFDTQLEDGIGLPKMARCGSRVCTVAFQYLSVLDDAGKVIRRRENPTDQPCNAILHNAGGTFVYCTDRIISLQ